MLYGLNRADAEGFRLLVPAETGDFDVYHARRGARLV